MGERRVNAAAPTRRTQLGDLVIRARAAWLGLLTTTVGAAALAVPALAAEEADADRIIVTAIRPDRFETLPGDQVIDPAEAMAGGLPSLGDLLAREGASVTISEPQGNPFQPELSYRGYSVSGLLGLPQGLALFQNGARVNEAFGDVVNFDVLPEAA